LSFRGLLRPGQGIKRFSILRREGGTTAGGRPYTGGLSAQGEFLGFITQATPKEIEQFKQLGTPITHTILQRGAKPRAKATDILELKLSSTDQESTPRRFIVHGEPKNPGELGHVLIYTVEERADLK